MIFALQNFGWSSANKLNGIIERILFLFTDCKEYRIWKNKGPFRWNLLISSGINSMVSAKAMFF